jgi:hypothetical protein
MPSWAGTLRCLGGPTGEALQRHVEGLLLDAGRFGREAELLRRLDPDADLVGGLAYSIGGRDRSVRQGGEAADRGHASERAAERADARAQQFRLAAEAHKPTRGYAARHLDALQALLAALADRDQLSLDLTAALDRQADGVGGGASGHGSASILGFGAYGVGGGGSRRTVGRTAPCGNSARAVQRRKQPIAALNGSCSRCHVGWRAAHRSSFGRLALQRHIDSAVLRI